MFEHFDPETQNALVTYALEAARALGHDHIGTEHLLVAVARLDQSLAVRVMRDLDIDPATVDAEVVAVVGRGSTTSGQLRFTDHATHAVGMATQEALRLGHHRNGAEHLLLGLVRDPQCRAAQVLRTRYGVDYAQVRAKLLQFLNQAQPGFGPGSTPSLGELRKVVPIAHEVRPEAGGRTILIAAEVWDDRLVIHVAEQPLAVRPNPGEHVGWRVTDDAGTLYAPCGGGGGGADIAHYRWEFEPGPPERATRLFITSPRMQPDEVLEVSLV